MNRFLLRAHLKSPYSAASAAFVPILRGLRLTGLLACAPQPAASHVKIDAFATKGGFRWALTTTLALGLFAAAAPVSAAGFQTERGRQSDGPSADAIFADDLIRYTRLFVEPAFRLKGGNTANGKGIEAGIIGAHDKYGPAIGFSVGYYQFDSKNNSDFTYRIVPVMLRAGGDILLTPGGTRFALWVGGGYSLNNYTDNTPGLTVDVDNSYVLMGQMGLKFPISNYLAVSVLGGYQYLKPLVTVNTGGLTTSAYTALDAGFVKVAVEF